MKPCVDGVWGPASKSPVFRLSSRLTFRGSALPLLLPGRQLSSFWKPSVLGKPQHFSVSWFPMSHPDSHPSCALPITFRCLPRGPWFYLFICSVHTTFSGLALLPVGLGSSVLDQGSWGLVGKLATSISPVEGGVRGRGVALRNELGVSGRNIQHSSSSLARAGTMPASSLCVCVCIEWMEERGFTGMNPEHFPGQAQVEVDPGREEGVRAWKRGSGVFGTR